MSSQGTRRLRLTAAGWTTAATATLSAGAGRIAGIEEFVAAALIAAAAIVAAALVAWLGGRTLSVSRSLSATRVTVGAEVRIDLAIGSAGASRPAPFRLPRRVVAELAERSGVRRVVVTTAATRSVSLAQRARQRGLLSVGSVRVSVTDPLGLFEHSLRDDDRCAVLVVPNVVDLGEAHAPASPAGDSGALRHDERPGDDFDALRDYVPGDDIRLLHWPSTARLGTPVVRVMEPLERRRTAVLLHRGGPDVDLDAFERAVVAAASVIASCLAAGETVRFLIDGTTGGESIVHPDDLAAMLERLALVAPDDAAAPLAPRALRNAGPAGDHSRLVVCCARVDDALRELCAVESAAGCEVVVVETHERSGADGSAPARPLTRVPFGPHDQLAETWAAAVSSGRR